MAQPRAAVLALALLLPALGGAAPRRTLAVAAAANLQPTLDAVARAFEAERQGVEVRVTFGASGTLHAQILAGAPFDVFFSADRASPRALVAAGLAAGEEVYALGRLAVWVPNGSPLDLARDGLGALAHPEVRRVAMPNPALAPSGRAAEAALREAGIWEAVRPKLVLGESVAQTAQFAHSGAADAAFVPRSLALLPALAAAGRAVAVSARAHPAIEQSAVVLARARDPELARAFLAFARGEKGRALLAEAGYGLP
jgi:molybdate transport system substrate-binding protein